MIKIADSKNLLGLFNQQHSQVLSVTEEEKNQLPEQNFHGPKARKIVTWYSSHIRWDPSTDKYTVNDEKRWPLRGIVDDGPNLQHVLAAFFHLKKEHDLAWNLFLTPEDVLALFSTTLEVSVRFRALTIFGFSGFPLYAHYHLHGPSFAGLPARARQQWHPVTSTSLSSKFHERIFIQSASANLSLSHNTATMSKSLVFHCTWLD